MTSFWHNLRTKITSQRGLVGSLLALVLFGLFLRLWSFSAIPMAYYHDELDYVITGQSIRQWGTDLPGNWKPSSLTPVKTQNITAEVTPIIHAAVQTLFRPEVTYGRITGVIFGLATVVLTGLLFWLLLQRWEPAVLAMVGVGTNPWHIYLSRLGYEAVISLFFQVLFIYSAVLFTKATTRRGIFFSLLLGASAQWMSYYTYHSVKFLIPILTITLLGWIAFQRRSWKLSIISIVVFLGCTVSLLGHSIAVQKAGLFGERKSELLFSTEYLQETVNLSRHQALTIPGMRWWYNKPSVLASELVKHYVSVFDIYRLFVSGYEGGFQFSLAVHGFFTLSSIPLLVLGAVWLWRNARSTAVLVFSLLVVAPIPSAIMRSYQSIFRSALVYFLLATLVGIGMWSAWQWLSKRRWGKLVLPILMLFFLSELAWFGTRYFSRYPIVTADNHYFSQKLLAGYLFRSNRPTEVVLENNMFSTARSFVFYNQKLAELSPQERQQFSRQSAGYTIGNVHFDQSCPNTPLNENTLYVVETGQFETCHLADYLATASSNLVKIRSTDSGQVFDLPGLASPIDNRTYYYLLGDTTCASLPESTFIHPNELRLFNVHALSDQELCQNWVKLDPKPVPSL